MHKLIEALESNHTNFSDINIDNMNLYFTYDDIKDKTVKELLVEANKLTLISFAGLVTQYDKISKAKDISPMQSNVEGFV